MGAHADTDTPQFRVGLWVTVGGVVSTVILGALAVLPTPPTNLPATSWNSAWLWANANRPYYALLALFVGLLSLVFWALWGLWWLIIDPRIREHMRYEAMLSEQKAPIDLEVLSTLRSQAGFFRQTKCWKLPDAEFDKVWATKWCSLTDALCDHFWPEHGFHGMIEEYNRLVTPQKADAHSMAVRKQHRRDMKSVLPFIERTLDDLAGGGNPK